MADLNSTPSGERVHIGFFGVRNAGKSSLVNAVTGQDLAVVSDVAGTTTDPVSKAMELLPVGPVMIIDTPGMDDAGSLGELRVRKARQALRRCDVAVLVVDATRGMQQADRDLIALFERSNVAHLVVYNKCDLLKKDACKQLSADGSAIVSAASGSGVHELKERIAQLAEGAEKRKLLIGDILDEGDLVILVIPIDESAPKGRIILPQQMTIRDVLDAHATCLSCQPEELANVLESLGRPPRLVVTDSQVFPEVAAIVPEDVQLTSFSILMARYKGELGQFLGGARAIASLEDGDRVLISEGCTHHRQCEDIGTVKMPAWIRAASGAEPVFEFTSGGEFPDDLSDFALVVHCGGCTLPDKEMAHRVEVCQAQGVPIANYGMAIASMNGILERALRSFEAQ